jgi:transcriptional regulator with XRE-family HTH domain
LKKEHADLAFVFKKLRKTAGLSQIEMAKILDRDQATISRLEKGTQSLSLESVFALSDFFQISYDDLLSGKINYWAISVKFNTPLKINPRYTTNNDSYVRELQPLFKFIIKKYSTAKLESILDDMGILDIIYMTGSKRISALIYPDFLSLVLSRGIVLAEDTAEIVKLSNSLEYHGSFYDVYKKQDSQIDVLKAYCINSSQYEGAFRNNILEFNERTISIGLSIKDNVRDFDFSQNKLGNFIIQLKRTYLSELPSAFGFDPVIAKVAQNKNQSLKDEVIFKMIAS